MENYLNVLRQYKNFYGRASRREYWMFVLINTLISIGLAMIEQVLFSGTSLLSGLYTLVVIIPGVAVTIRRLHDIGKSGWMQLIILIPLIGSIWFLILMAREGEHGGNQYGNDLRETRF